MNVRETWLDPSAGITVGSVKLNVPGTDAAPPVRLAPASDPPSVIVPNLGRLVIVGVARSTDSEINPESGR